jgi:hypothetical protein
MEAGAAGGEAFRQSRPLPLEALGMALGEFEKQFQSLVPLQPLEMHVR